MIRIVLVVAAFLALLMLSRYLRAKPPEARKKFYIRLLVSSLIGLVFFLAITGRLHFMTAVIAGVLPFIKKLWPLIRYVPVLRRFYKQVQAARASRVDTSLLKMMLDHESGDLDGEILEGPYTGRRLSTLSMSELMHVHRVAQSDYQDSVAVLEAYLDRMHGKQWRDQAEFQEGRSAVQSGDMSLKDAYSILGLEEGASKDEVVHAHRKLMQKLHPDRGGSDFLAAQVNKAKEIILEHL